jgi:CPA2 family monovalent cation:H+ antiporter-2
LITDPESFSLIAEFGVAFLLFSIGLEFSLPKMLKLKFAVFGLGSIQVVSSVIIFTLAVYLWGTTLNAAIIIAGALALSSTAIVSRELSDQQQFTSHYAQLTMGVLLFIALMATGKWVLPAVYAEVARARSDEIFGLITLVIAFITAWLAHAIGLSMALGGFVIGMMLSEGPFKHQIIADIRPFKDVLLGLFFVTVGMNIDLTLIPTYWPRLLIFTMGLIAINTIIVYLVVMFMGEDRRVSMRVGIALAQAGEFGLALLTLAKMNGVVPPDQASFIILIAVLSMLLSPMLIRNSRQLSDKLINILPGSDIANKPKLNLVDLHHSGHAVIGGFGRVGQTIAHLLDRNDIPYIGIDHDIEIVSKCRERGDNVIFGDCTKLEILKSCHISDARLTVLTFKSLNLAKDTIREIRRQNIQVPIIVRCYEHGNFEELISVGADWVVSEMLEASLIISSQVLTILEIDSHTIEQQLEEIRTRKGIDTAL